MNRVRRQARRGARRRRGVAARRAAAARACPAGCSCAWSREAIGRLAARLERGSVVISATNGKTTTAQMAAAILERSGARLVHNRAGANMAGGVATTLAAAARPGRRMDGDLGLFEVDEFWLGQVAADLHPRAMLLANLFRDQLDRYGELDTIADRWARGRGHDPRPPGPQRRRPRRWPTSAASRDDAAVLRRRRTRALALPDMQHAADAKHCRRCGAPYRYDAIFLGPPRPLPLRGVRRTAPGARRGAPRTSCWRACAARASRSSRPQGSVPVRIGLPGLYNVYNALGAAALALALGTPLRDVAGRPGGGRARVRARRDDARRRPRARDPARQEPRRRQRGAAHARARARRARRCSACSTTASPTAAT